MKFKTGDRVEILPYATSVGVAKDEVGKMGTIHFISNYVCNYHGIIIQMEEICKSRGYIPTWLVGNEMIKLVSSKNQ